MDGGTLPGRKTSTTVDPIRTDRDGGPVGRYQHDHQTYRDDRGAAQCCVPIAATDMDADDAASTAALFKALGDPTACAWSTLLATAREAVCVWQSLTDFLGLSQPAVSHHMRKR